MRYLLKCKCGATCTAPGEDDPDTNSTEYNLDGAVWTGGHDVECPHDDFICAGVDYHDDDFNPEF
jgi:hypothetical protein